MKLAILALLVAVLGVPQFGLSAEPELLGHWELGWQLDANGRRIASDSNGGRNPGKIIGQPGRASSPFGDAMSPHGAMTFNGKDTYVELPNSKDLDQIQAGSYTIAAWFRPEIVPPGKEDTANAAEFGIVMKTGWHEGLSYSKNKQFNMHHWLAGNGEPMWNGIGTWEDEYEPGRWHYVVGVVDQKEHVVKIYVNGTLRRASDPWPNGAKSRDYEQQTWKIGVASPGADQYAWYAKGSISDVRIYKDVLPEHTIKSRYDVGTNGK